MNTRQDDVLEKAKRSTRGSVVAYAVIKLLLYIVAADSSYWIPRAAAGAVMLIAAFGITSIRSLSRRKMSVLAPLSVALTEIVLCGLIDGDRTVYFFMIGVAMMSLLYLDSVGLLITMVLSAAAISFCSFVLRLPMLGVEFTYYDQMASFSGLALVNLLLYYVCRYSVGVSRQSRRTGEAFRMVLDTTPNHLVVINENARVDFVSRSFGEFLGLSDQQYAVNMPLLDLCNSSTLQMVFQEVMETGENVERSFEVEIDGENYWFMLRSALAGKHSIARIIELSDITPIMEAKNVAEAATKAKSSFLANMSHEIRTPMNAIIGLTELIMLKPLDFEQLNHAVAIKGASMSLLNIINDILDFSKIDAEKMEIINKPFDVSSLVNDTVNIINVKAAPTGIAFTANVSKDVPPRVCCDELRLKQILLNLLNNALKFTNQGSVALSFASEHLGGNTVKLKFSIKDTGIGIKKEEIGKLFGAFEQVDTHRNRGVEGTGLGLAISRRLVELMGGGISVESEYGKGSNFSFYIICEDDSSGVLAALPEPEHKHVVCYEPNEYYAESLRAMLRDLGVSHFVCENLSDFEDKLEEKTPTHVLFERSGESLLRKQMLGGSVACVLIKGVNEANEMQYVSINKPILITGLTKLLGGQYAEGQEGPGKDEIVLGAFSTKNANVLLVDDNPVNLTVAEGMLRQYGINVITASGGREGIAKASSGIFDIVFMDHMMPDVDGIDATKEIRALKGRFETLPIIALSANAVTGAEELFREAGMNDFLSKPIVIKKLNKILLTYLPQEKLVNLSPDELIEIRR